MRARASSLRLPEWYWIARVPGSARIDHATVLSLAMLARSSSVVKSSFWPHSSIHAETSDSAFNLAVWHRETVTSDRPANSIRAFNCTRSWHTSSDTHLRSSAKSEPADRIDTRVTRLEVAGANPTSQYRRQERAWVVEIRI